MRFLYIIYQICIGLPIFLVATILTALTTMLGCWLGGRSFLGILSRKAVVTAYLFPVFASG